MQIDLVRHGPGQADDVFHATRQPVFVFEDGNDDFGNAKGGNRQIVRPQPQGRFTNQPGRSGRQQPAHGPGQEHRPTKPTDIACQCRIDVFDRFNRRVKQGAIDDKPNNQDGHNQRRTQATFGQQTGCGNCRDHRQRPHHQCHDNARASGAPGTWGWRR